MMREMKQLSWMTKVYHQTCFFTLVYQASAHYLRLQQASNQTSHPAQPHIRLNGRPSHKLRSLDIHKRQNITFQQVHQAPMCHARPPCLITLKPSKQFPFRGLGPMPKKGSVNEEGNKCENPDTSMTRRRIPLPVPVL